MALLKFNYGLLKDLPAAKANGNLYITTDSQGLYVDLDDQRIHISDFIQVESLDALTALGSYSTEVFYYVSGSNALMKYTGIEGAEWKQLNSTAELSKAISDLEKRVKANEDAITGLTSADTAINERIDNLDSEDIVTSGEITVTTAVGNFTKGQKIDANTDLQTLLLNMLSKDSNPTTTQPSLSVTLTGAGNKEVGTTFSPAYSASGNAGKYVANGKTQASNVTFSNYVVTEVNRPDTVVEETGGKSGSFTAFVVADDMDYYLTASADHTAGDMPKTYLGKDYPSGQISSGSKTASSSHVKGYRPIFYGMSASTDALTSASIRALTKIDSVPAAQSLGTVNAEGRYESFVASKLEGVKRFIVAIPQSAGLSVTKATILSSMNADATSNYVKQTAAIAVEGANGYTTTAPYDVWIYQPASIASVEVHEVTIA